MAKVKYDVADVEGVRARNVPPAGLYTCKVVACAVNKPSGKDRRIEVTYEITEGDYAGEQLRDWINMESETSAFKVRQFMDAMGLPPKGSFDPDDMVGNALSVRTIVENSDEYGAQARPRTLFALDGDEGEEDLSEETEDEDEQAESEEEEIEEDDEEEDDEEEGITLADLEEMDRNELKAFIKENELEFKVKKPHTEEQIREGIAAELEIGDEEDDEEDEEEEETDGFDVENASKSELVAECKRRGLPTAGTIVTLRKRIKKDEEPV